MTYKKNGFHTQIRLIIQVVKIFFIKLFTVFNFDNIGADTSELRLSKAFFDSNPSTKIWKVEFTVSTLSSINGFSTGTSSLQIYLNEIPKNGACTASPTSGFADDTLFNIQCLNWIDSDGTIEKYEYYGIKYVQ